MPGLSSRLCIIPLALALTTPGYAAPPRNYTCTNIMGGNPFRLTISDDLVYTAASHPESRVQIGGQGRLELAEIGVYYHVLDGPLLADLKVEVIHIMSHGRLSPSGSNGLFSCIKAK